PARPHTACVGARLCPVSPDADDSEDTESDGGSLDLEDSHGKNAFEQNETATGSTSPDKVEGDYVNGQPSGPTFSRGEWLLLSGLAGKVNESKASFSEDVHANSSCCEETRSKVKALPVSLAEKLPRTRVLQVGRSRGMAPQASRFKSHASWTSFLPLPARERAEQVAPKAPSVAQSSADAQKPVQRQAGPKYRVPPGGSRPARTESKAKMAKEFVLEFRSEPRVVPARRIIQDHRSQRRGQKCSETTPFHRFRQDDGRWALEREATQWCFYFSHIARFHVQFSIKGFTCRV
ncbi:unnamed protein product, partial [Cladocopium goreaui]